MRKQNVIQKPSLEIQILFKDFQKKFLSVETNPNILVFGLTFSKKAIEQVYIWDINFFPGLLVFEATFGVFMTTTKNPRQTEKKICKKLKKKL